MNGRSWRLHRGVPRGVVVQPQEHRQRRREARDLPQCICLRRVLHIAGERIWCAAGDRPEPASAPSRTTRESFSLLAESETET
jgi:hypothetical protein